MLVKQRAASFFLLSFLCSSRSNTLRIENAKLLAAIYNKFSPPPPSDFWLPTPRLWPFLRAKWEGLGGPLGERKEHAKLITPSGEKRRNTRCGTTENTTGKVVVARFLLCVCLCIYSSLWGEGFCNFVRTYANALVRYRALADCKQLVSGPVSVMALEARDSRARRVTPTALRPLLVASLLVTFN